MPKELTLTSPHQHLNHLYESEKQDIDENTEWQRMYSTLLGLFCGFVLRGAASM